MFRTLMSSLLLLGLGALPAAGLETRTFEHRFTLDAGETLRLANVAGTVEVVASPTNEVLISVEAHGENRVFLNELAFVRSNDRHGKTEWALSYPVEKYRSFHYPSLDRDEGGWDGGFFGRLFAGLFSGSSSSSRYLGHEVRVSSRASSSSPTLWADLRVALPATGRLEIRTLAGPMHGDGELVGNLRLDTSARGAVELASFRGTLEVDTGSGSVKLGRAAGEILVDTGSGGISIADLSGNANLDTGSGRIEVDRVDGERLIADTGSGGVTIRNGRVRELSADTGSGAVKVLDVEVETLRADTGSGGVTLHSSLAGARRVEIDTGAGGVEIIAGPAADFAITTSLGSGRLRVGYDDAKLQHDGRELVAATRGSGQTRIHVDTGSGGCDIRPAG